MTFKKGDTVTLNGIVGVIAPKVFKPETVNVIFFDASTQKIQQYENVSVNDQRLQIAEKSLMCPELKAFHDKEFKTVKKGAYVKFLDEDGKSQKGYVEKGGNMPTVVFDNGNYEIKLHASLLEEIDSITQEEPKSPMDNWAIINFKEQKNKSTSSVCFEAFLTYKGEKVLFIENDGRGDSNLIRGASKKTSKDDYLPVVSQFLKDLGVWVEQFGLTSELAFTDVDFLWVNWSVFEQKKGICAKDHLLSVIADKNHNLAQYVYGGEQRPTSMQQTA